MVEIKTCTCLFALNEDNTKHRINCPSYKEKIFVVVSNIHNECSLNNRYFTDWKTAINYYYKITQKTGCSMSIYAIEKYDTTLDD